MYIMNLKVTISLFIIFIVGADLIAQKKTIESEELFEMTLEDLMNIEISTGTLTKYKEYEAPLSKTVISSNDISVTPARNLLDLIEIYVPGATYVYHYKGPRLGVRGVSGDQNNSFLLLVNGKDVNMKSYLGPVSEILNKDLSDIERVEIIRGAGSVTYGPGAIGAVINIITKKADKSGDYYSLGGEFNNLYDYYTVNAGVNKNFGGLSGALNASYCYSGGLVDSKYFYIDRAHGYGYGYMSEDWGNKSTGSAAPVILNNYMDNPDIKLNLDLNYKDGLDFLLRYTTYSFSNIQQASKTLDGMSYPGTFGKTLTGSLGYKTDLAGHSTLKSYLSYNSHSAREVTFFQGADMPADHITNRSYSFSENEIKFHSLFNYHELDFAELALGIEASYYYLGPEWGMDDNTFILGFQAPIRFAVLDSSSEFFQTYPGFSTVIDETIDATVFSIFGEANIDLLENITLLLSGRADKHIYSKWALSPRVALIYEMNRQHIFKLIGQNSVRLGLFSDLYSENVINNTEADPEVLNSLEFIYNFTPYENLNLISSVYYNSIDQIAWISENELSGKIGEFELFGMELDLKYRHDIINCGLNFSYINQLEWDGVFTPMVELTNTNGDVMPVSNWGDNRINNMPSKALKFYCNIDLAYDLMLHINSRYMWDFGQRKICLIYIWMPIGNTGNEETAPEMTNIYNTMLDEGYTKPLFSLNMNLSYKLPVEFSDLIFSFYVQNLIANNNIRYVIQFLGGCKQAISQAMQLCRGNLCVLV